MPSHPKSGVGQLSRRRLLLGAVASGAAFSTAPVFAQSDATLKFAISLLDIPRLWGAPEGGFEGLRFGGYPIYDALINWDLRNPNTSELTPGLAVSWTTDPADRTRWIVKLRDDAVFHDGSRFDADAAVWNFDSMLNSKAPQFDAIRSGMNRSRLPSILRAEKIDGSTIAVLTETPDAMTPYQLSFLLMASPSQHAKLGGDWTKFAAQPSGTGPFRVTQLVPRTRLELARNAEYWDKNRVPKVSAMSLLPIPDPSSRVAALRAGQVDFIESVPPDTIASLTSAGFTVLSNLYPHMWGWRLSTLPDSIFKDIRVRRAANLAIDRGGLVEALNGTAVPAKGLVAPSSPWFGKPSFDVRYDPAEAKRLLADAGFGPKQRIKTQALISNSGGGQMQPLPMNEFIQANLAEIGIDVELKVVDFVTLFTAYRSGAKAPGLAGIGAINLATPTQEPSSSFLRGFLTDYAPPRGTNWDHYSSPELDRDLREAQQAFEPAAFNSALAKAHMRIVDDAAFLYVVHDTNPRALSRRASGFSHPRNWFADFTSISLG
jgi:peptide/nickel transport system substrate-binding protein